MSKKTQRMVSISVIDQFLKDGDTAPGVEVVTLTLNTAAMDVEVKRSVSLQDYHSMVTAAADGQFQTDEHGNEVYAPALRRCAMEMALIAYLTNIKTEAGCDRLARLCHETDLIEEIYHVTGPVFQADFEADVEEQVKHRQQMLIAQQQGKLMEIARQLEAATTAFQKLGENFKDTDGAQLIAMLEKYSNMSEERLGEAVVNARDKDFVERRREELAEHGEH